jgi:tRNA threonylcarbamoyladenosine biosynthesis protein TsaE
VRAKLAERFAIQAFQLQSSVHLSTTLETRTLRTLLWPNEAACATSALALASHAGLRDAFIELHGPLGAGKTTFVRHLLHALGVQGRVKSPTYAVMEPYEVIHGGAAFNVWHFDFYRFNDPQEWEDAGFRDVFASRGLKLAEWPEKAAGLLPPADVRIYIEPLQDEVRHVRFTALGELGMELIA